MKFALRALIFACFMLSCGPNAQKDISIESQYSEPVPTEEIFTLEKSIGGEGSEADLGKIRIIRPSFGRNIIGVTSEGETYVFDLGVIKVFDENGMLKKTITNPESETGLFNGELSLNPAGFLICVTNSSMRPSRARWNTSDSKYEYLLFAPDFSFIEKRQLISYRFEIKRVKNRPTIFTGMDEDGFYRLPAVIQEGDSQIFDYLKTQNIDSSNTRILSIPSVYPVSRNEALIQISTITDPGYFITLFYEKEGILQPVFHLKKPNLIRNNDNTSGYLGGVYWRLLHEGKVIYVNTDEEVFDDPGSSYYTMHIVSLNDMSDKVIKRRYNPERINRRIAGRTVEGWLFNGYNRKVAQVYRDRKYQPHVSGIQVDGKYAFIRTSGNKFGNHRMEVFDTETGELVSWGYFPGYRSSEDIEFFRNGYRYYFTQNYEGAPINIWDNRFVVLQKYKINPAVYGK